MAAGSPAPRRHRATVVIVTHESRGVLPGLIESLDAGMAELDWSVVVADSASRDGSAELARELLPQATVLELAENRGFAAGLNAAMSESEPDADLLIVNPDVRLAPRCGAELLGQLDRRMDDASVGIVVPRLVDERGALLPALRHEPAIRRVLAETFLGTRRAGLRGLG